MMGERLEQLLEQLGKTDPKRKWGGLAIAIVVLVGLHYYFFYTDQAEAIRKAKNSFNQLTLERSEKENYAQNMAVYEAKLNELQNELQKAQSLLPDSGQVANLLGELSQLGERFMLTIDRFEPRKEILQDFYAEIPFRTKLTGNYHDIAMFIDSVGKMDRIVNVSGLSMNTPKVINKKIVVECEMTITTFRFLRQGEAPPKKKTAKGGKKAK